MHSYRNKFSNFLDFQKLIFLYLLNANFVVPFFVQRDSLNAHIESDHEGKKQLSLKCKFCGVFFFVQRDSLNAHIESNHEGKKPFTCNICKPALQISII